MDEKVQQKLLELGYDHERREKATYPNLISISRGYLGGLILFEGRVIARDRCRSMVDDKNVAITGFRTQDSNSLYEDILEKKLDENTVVDPRSGYFSTLYISPLERKFEGEGICLDYICPSDRIYVANYRKNTFILIIEDLRKNRLASFEFCTNGAMLYVPKRR